LFFFVRNGCPKRMSARQSNNDGSLHGKKWGGKQHDGRARRIVNGGLPRPNEYENFHLCKKTCHTGEGRWGELIRFGRKKGVNKSHIYRELEGAGHGLH